MAKKAKKKKSTALAIVDDNNALMESLTEEQLAAMLVQQMDGVEAIFPEIKILHAGAEMFDMGGEKVEEVECVIVFRHMANAYWEESYDESGAGTAPDCSSMAPGAREGHRDRCARAGDVDRVRALRESASQAQAVTA